MLFAKIPGKKSFPIRFKYFKILLQCQRRVISPSEWRNVNFNNAFFGQNATTMHPKNWRCIIESESLEKTYKMSLIIYLLEKQKQIFVFAVASGFSLFDTPFPKCQ